METLINMYAGASGLWKKVATYLPLIIGVGTLLSGVAGFCLELGHSANASAMLHVLQNIQSDPNSALVIAGLGALGIHTNHTTNAANIQTNSQQIVENKP